jgi:hypothetical protein
MPQSPEAVAGFAAALRSAGYSARGVRKAIGSGAAVSVHPAEVPAVQSRLDHRSPLRALIELFLLGVEVPAPDAEAALLETVDATDNAVRWAVPPGSTPPGRSGGAGSGVA